MRQGQRLRSGRRRPRRRAGGINISVWMAVSVVAANLRRVVARLRCR